MSTGVYIIYREGIYSEQTNEFESILYSNANITYPIIKYI